MSSKTGSPVVSQSEGFLLPGSPLAVDEQATHILQDIAHPHEHTLVDQGGSFHLDLEDEEHDAEVTAWKALPWWKRPSPYWLVLVPTLCRKCC